MTTYKFQISVNDTLISMNSLTSVVKIEFGVSYLSFHNPITESGNIIVNGIMASVYGVAPAFTYKMESLSGHQFSHGIYRFMDHYYHDKVQLMDQKFSNHEGMDHVTYFICRSLQPLIYKLIGTPKGKSIYKLQNKTLWNLFKSIANI